MTAKKVNPRLRSMVKKHWSEFQRTYTLDNRALKDPKTLQLIYEKAFIDGWDAKGD